MRARRRAAPRARSARGERPAKPTEYDPDGKLELAARTDGFVLDYLYDSTTGRLDRLDVVDDTAAVVGTVGYSYYATTDRALGAVQGALQTVTALDGSSITFAYDGFLPRSTTWVGLDVNGVVSNTYTNDFQVASQSVGGGQTVSFAYDLDGLLTQAGELAITRDAASGQVLTAMLETVQDGNPTLAGWSLEYNSFGELSRQDAGFQDGSLAPVMLYDAMYTDRDQEGRITAVTESLVNDLGVTSTREYGYLYDARGRLSEVYEDSTLAREYTYDANGNRTTLTEGGATVAYTYDEQDRLLSHNAGFGATECSYTPHGNLWTKTDVSGTTSYTYDVFGNLLHVHLPGGDVIEYLVDASNRRIGRKKNGAFELGLLYQDQLNPVAELDDGGNVVSQFVYGTRGHVPDYMISSKLSATPRKYMLVSNHLGSVRLVVDALTGEVAQRIDYDEWGNVLLDTNPGFQPFGFAGGLYDADTALVRFGARDYDAETGRWTAKDPILFDGGQENLYAYVNQDPLNAIDPGGMYCQLKCREIEPRREFEPSPFEGPKKVEIVLTFPGVCSGLPAVFRCTGQNGVTWAYRRYECTEVPTEACDNCSSKPEIIEEEEPSDELSRHSQATNLGTCEFVSCSRYASR